MMNRYEEGRRLSRCFTLRMNVFLGILALTGLLTVLRPSFLIEWFQSSPVEMLSRLWVIASLVTTIIITFYANIEIVKDGAQARMTDPNWGTRIATASGLNAIILLYCVITIVLTAIPATPLLAIYMLSGSGLVMLVMRFDWHLLGIAESRLDEVKSTHARSSARIPVPANAPSGPGAEQDDHATELDDAEAARAAAEQTFFKLDIPILAGVIITFVVGQLLLPHVMLPTDTTAVMVRTYADGFASGATAIQIVVGNVTYGMITALAGR